MGRILDILILDKQKSFHHNHSRIDRKRQERLFPHHRKSSFPISRDELSLQLFIIIIKSD